MKIVPVGVDRLRGLGEPDSFLEARVVPTSRWQNGSREFPKPAISSCGPSVLGPVPVAQADGQGRDSLDNSTAQHEFRPDSVRAWPMRWERS